LEVLEMAKAGRKQGKKQAAQLKSVTLKLRHGAPALEKLRQIEASDCIDCEVSIKEITPSIGAPGKQATISPASLKTRGGEWRLTPGTQNDSGITIRRRDLLGNPHVVPITL